MDVLFVCFAGSMCLIFCGGGKPDFFIFYTEVFGNTHPVNQRYQDSFQG